MATLKHSNHLPDKCSYSLKQSLCKKQFDSVSL